MLEKDKVWYTFLARLHSHLDHLANVATDLNQMNCVDSV